VYRLLLNANKLEAICLSTPSQLRAATDTVTVAGSTSLVSEEICLLSVTIDRRLTFESHILAVIKSCNYHMRELQHIRHLLLFSAAQTLACSLILSRLDYCNAVLYSCSARAISRLQCVQNCACCDSQTVTCHHSNCYNRCTGCQFSSRLFTKQLLSHTKL